ncbi:MAG TPA: hypothetical protein V6C57_15405 [Coleofasciculaceae cyanobacterium]
MALNSTNGSHNGSKPPLPHWKQQSVQTFFSTFNWDDHSPKVQELKLTAFQQPSDQPLSLTLKVSEFFGTVNWDGNAIANPLNFLEEFPTESASDAFTLEDFSDLF